MHGWILSTGFWCNQYCSIECCVNIRWVSNWKQNDVSRCKLQTGASNTYALPCATHRRPSPSNLPRWTARRRHAGKCRNTYLPVTELLTRFSLSLHLSIRQCNIETHCIRKKTNVIVHSLLYTKVKAPGVNKGAKTTGPSRGSCRKAGEENKDNLITQDEGKSSIKQSYALTKCLCAKESWAVHEGHRSCPLALR